jgi:hypothetical protein
MRSVFTFALLSLFAGCAGLRPVVRKSGPSAESQTASWRETILREGQDGDWLVIRGYNSSDHLVALMANAELSHVGILDAGKDQVIEAVAPVVRCVSLQAFLEGADRVLLVRPANADTASGRIARDKARSRIGAPYDFLGTMGLPDKDRFYCSELAAWSAGRDVDRDGPDEILYPDAIPRLGTVLFDSEPRSAD